MTIRKGSRVQHVDNRTGSVLFRVTGRDRVKVAWDTRPERPSTVATQFLRPGPPKARRRSGAPA